MRDATDGLQTIQLQRFQMDQPKVENKMKIIQDEKSSFVQNQLNQRFEPEISKIIKSEYGYDFEKAQINSKRSRTSGRALTQLEQYKNKNLDLNRGANKGVFQFLYAKNTGLEKSERPEDKNLYPSQDNLAKNGYGQTYDPSQLYYQQQPSILDGVYNAKLNEVNN